MNGPISKDIIKDGLMKHIATELQIELTDEDEVVGLSYMATAAIEYFSSSCNGAPPGSERALMWSMFSGMWSGKYEQELIDKFFSNINLDVDKLFKVFNNFNDNEKEATYTVALIPGSLTDADIAHVIESLFNNKLIKS